MPLSSPMSSEISVPQAVPVVDDTTDMIALAHLISEMACQRSVQAPCPVCEAHLRQTVCEEAAAEYRQRFPLTIGVARHSHITCAEHRPSVLA